MWSRAQLGPGGDLAPPQPPPAVLGRHQRDALDLAVVDAEGGGEVGR